MKLFSSVYLRKTVLLNKKFYIEQKYELNKSKKIMITDKLNTGLINLMKEKIPDGVNLATLLMDTLYIGKEAVYRRLRGEVPFTLAEAAVISQKLGVSLDKLTGENFSGNAMFKLNIINYEDPIETYYTIIDNYVSIFKEYAKEPDTEFATASNIVPQTLYLKYEMLSKFRLFKWMYQHDKINSSIKCFEDIPLSNKLLDRQKEFVIESQKFNTSYHIWDSMIFLHLVNDIKYFTMIKLISEENIKKIKEELLVFLDELEEIAARGKYASGKDVHIFISNINFEATYSYAATRYSHISLIRVYAINSITSFDTAMFESLKEWIQSLRKFATLISQSGEIQRRQFFQEQRDIVNTL